MPEKLQDGFQITIPDVNSQTQKWSVNLQLSVSSVQPKIPVVQGSFAGGS